MIYDSIYPLIYSIYSIESLQEIPLLQNGDYQTIKYSESINGLYYEFKLDESAENYNIYICNPEETPANQGPSKFVSLLITIAMIGVPIIIIICVLIKKQRKV